MLKLEERMTEFKHRWTVESAMHILAHPTVDRRIWAEAVEWLLLYGPPEIRELITHASGYATRKEFPDLKAEGYTREGEPVYSIARLARVLNISEEEAAEMIAAKEQEHGTLHRYDARDTKKVQ